MIADEYGTETTVTILKGKVPLSGDGEHPVYHDRGGHWSSCRRSKHLTRFQVNIALLKTVNVV